MWVFALSSDFVGVLTVLYPYKFPIWLYDFFKIENDPKNAFFVM